VTPITESIWVGGREREVLPGDLILRSLTIELVSHELVSYVTNRTASALRADRRETALHEAGQAWSYMSDRVDDFTTHLVRVRA